MPRSRITTLMRFGIFGFSLRTEAEPAEPGMIVEADGVREEARVKWTEWWFLLLPTTLHDVFRLRCKACNTHQGHARRMDQDTVEVDELRLWAHLVDKHGAPESMLMAVSVCVVCRQRGHRYCLPSRFDT